MYNQKHIKLGLSNSSSSNKEENYGKHLEHNYVYTETYWIKTSSKTSSKNNTEEKYGKHFGHNYVLKEKLKIIKTIKPEVIKIRKTMENIWVIILYSRFADVHCN